jgi:hypothetical protein
MGICCAPLMRPPSYFPTVGCYASLTLVTEITNSAKEFDTQDFRNSSGSLAIFTPILRASSLLSSLAARIAIIQIASAANHNDGRAVMVLRPTYPLV